MNILIDKLESTVIPYVSVKEFDTKKLIYDLRSKDISIAICNKVSKHEPLTLLDITLLVASGVAKSLDRDTHGVWSRNVLYQMIYTTLVHMQQVVIIDNGESFQLVFIDKQDPKDAVELEQYIDDIEESIYGYYSFVNATTQDYTIPSTKVEPYFKWLEIVHEVLNAVVSMYPTIQHSMSDENVIKLKNGYTSPIRCTNASLVSVMIGGYLHEIFPGAFVPEILGYTDLKSLSEFFHFKVFDFSDWGEVKEGDIIVGGVFTPYIKGVFAYLDNGRCYGYTIDGRCKDITGNTTPLFIVRVY